MSSKMSKTNNMHKALSNLRAKLDMLEDMPGDEPRYADDTSLADLGVYLLFDPIDEGTAYDLCEFIIKANYVFEDDRPITIFVNTPGGSVYDGFSIVDVMTTSRVPIQTVAMGAVCSMGSLIFTSGTPGKRIMTKNAYIMTHQFSQSGGGPAKFHELVASREHEDELHARFIDHFVKTTKLSKDQIEGILLNHTDKWLTAEDALKHGICDKIANPWDHRSQ